MRQLLLGVLILAGIGAYSQGSLKGSIRDTLEKRDLQHAVISLLHKKDSTLYKFTRTDKSGRFHISSIDTGTYLMLVTYPKFADYADEVQIGTGEKDLGEMPLIQKSALLETVIVKQQWSIRMKGDTVEYKADSFKVSEGASVKDLLRKLPGLQIDKNGQITAQGEKVEKVLVDGEEFFSDDPAVVTENLRADAVDKVQSFDKKSAQSEFTGVDDGSRSKTLNLVLKDDKKKGYLGKIVLGGGTEERYSGEAMMNYFKGKKKASVYGIASNTGKTGLGWDDRNKFGGGNDFEDADVEMGAGFIMINSDGDADFSDWGERFNDEGIPRVIKAGAHYSDKWNGDKQKANGNITHKDTRVYAKGNSFYKYFLPDSAYYSRENHVNSTRQRQQMFAGTYDLKMDSLSSLRIKLNGKLENNQNNYGNATQVEDEELRVVNRNNRNTITESDAKTFLVNALWRQKFKKKGRTLSLSVSQKKNEEESDGYLFSTTEFFNTSGGLLRDQKIDQFKTRFSNKNTTSGKLVYTEPAGKKSLVEFNYSMQRINSILDRKTFDKEGTKYTALNDSLSLRYGLNYLSNSAGLKYQYNGKKFIANIGTNLGVSTYKQEDSVGRKVRELNYTNLFPSARITYRMTPQRALNFTYSGSPQPPGIEQVQPIRENSNPLFITIGNPDLDQSFNHNFSVFFTDFKMLTGRNIWLNGSFNPVQNAIVSNQVIDSGITRQQYVNANGNFNYWFYGSYGFKLKKLDIQTGFNLNTNGSRFVNYINGKENESRNSATGFGIYASKYKENKFDGSINADANYNRSVSGGMQQKNNFWSYSFSGRGNYFITKKWQLSADFSTDLTPSTEVFATSNNITIVNASIQRRFFKKNNASIKLEVNDLLKQRRGFRRSFNNNFLTERNYNILGRYAMLSFNWNFSKTPGSK